MVHTEILQESVVCSYLNDQRYTTLERRSWRTLQDRRTGGISLHATTCHNRPYSIGHRQGFPMNDMLNRICKRQKRSSFSRSILSIGHSKAQAGLRRIGRRRGRRRGSLTVLWHAEAGDVTRATAGPRILNVQIARDNTAALRPVV